MDQSLYVTCQSSAIIDFARAHRRRTQNYILELEKEVLRFRTREAELLAELEYYRSRGDLQNGSQSQTTEDQDMSRNGSLLSKPKPSTVTVDFSSYELTEPQYPCSVTGAFQSMPNFSPSPYTEIPIESTEGTNISDMPLADSTSTYTMNSQNAIDFILE